MKTTIKTFVKKISFALVLASSLALTSCTIGLGEAVDLHGPTVAITAPEARENVKDKFRIAGTVQDDFDIWYVTVTIKDGDTVKGEWRNENNTWKHKETSDADYTPYENATWNISETGKAAEWAINDASISGQGTFTIVVSAVDKSGNASEESTKSRDVIIDGEPPKITISSPSLSANKETFNIADYKDITKISLFQTGDFTIYGNAKDDNSIAWLELYIKDAENGEVYFEKKMTLDDVDSLRSWEIPVTLKNCKLQDLDSQKHVLQIYTKTADAAGNTNDDLISQGYTCLWKEADKPWITLPELEGTTDAVTYSIYSGSPIQGTAYDDTGISKVTVSVYEGDGFTKAVEGYENRVVYEGGEENENTAQFELETPEDCKKYKVVLTAYDNNGKQSDTLEGYVKVEDKTYPAIEITYSDGKNENMVGGKTGSDSLFGDTNGDFTLNIRALDDTQVTSVKMVHITNAEDVLNYASASYDNWKNISDIAVTTTGEIDNSLKGVSRKEYKAYKQMNIFSTEADGLGIDGNTKKLGNQTFVFRVEDNNGNATTRTFTIQGDTESPAIKFTKMEYYQDGKTLTETYTGGETLPAFGLESKVKVYGTISDNSASRWGYEKAFDLDKTLAEKRFKLSSGNQLDPTINTATGEFTAELNNLKGASLIFDATLTDYNGNTDTQKFSFLVDTQIPTVDYISSDNENKCYKANDQIDIYIRFNMQMKFTGSPSLTLNNGATAAAKTTAGTYTNQFVFTYTVGENDTETDDLNVTTVNLNNVNIYRKDSNGSDEDITSDIKTQLTALTAKANLSEMKDIVILINAPKLASEPVWNETAGTLTLKYDKAVSKGSGDVTITQQTKGGADGIDKVPPVILKSKYDTLVKTATNLGTYYEAGINGTDGTDWKPDYTAKYILKWEYNADNSYAIDEYKRAGTYKLTCNVKSSKVTLSSDCKTVTVNFGASPLPCKGANYKVVIPEGFMQHQKGGSDYPTAKKDDMTITAARMEAPVIRISTESKTKIAATSSGSGYVATQPFKSSFKIDCESDYDSLTYHWDLLEYTPTEVWTKEENDAGGTQIENGKLGSGTRVPANGETSYTAGTEVKIGIDNDYSGLTYRITATATKTDGASAKGYNKACRSGIEIKDFNKLHEGDVITNTSAGWLGGTNSTKIGLFIKGGDNPSGGNNVDGLPVTWSPTDYTKYLMFTETKTGGDYTYNLLTWDITSEKLYFWLFAGIMDNGTVTDVNGVSKGPNYVNAAQNNYTNKYKEYPLGQGEYIKITNKVNKGDKYSNVGFSVADAGKPTKVREPQN